MSDGLVVVFETSRACAYEVRDSSAGAARRVSFGAILLSIFFMNLADSMEGITINIFFHILKRNVLC